MTASTFPVVGIGASASGIDAFQHFFEPLPGFDHHLTKPIDPAILEPWFDRHG